MDENRDFGWALKRLREGCAVRRSDWESGLRLMIWEMDDDEGTKEFLCLDSMDREEGQRSIVPWLASQTDLLAEDWELHELED